MLADAAFYFRIYIYSFIFLLTNRPVKRHKFVKIYNLE